MSNEDTLTVHLERGRELRLEGRLEEALQNFEAALRLDAGCARAHAGYGGTLARMGHPGRAIEAYWESLRIQPTQPRVYGALASLYMEQGRADCAADCFRQAVAQDPDDEILRSNLLYALNFDSRVSPEEVFREHCEFGKRLKGAGAAVAAHSRRPARRLKIGYVSGDFYDHPVAYSFEPILENHRRRAFEITLYSSTSKPDVVTERLRRLAPRWRDVRAATDEELAAIVRRDRIDILVDLTGHTSIARLGTFARKPAPVQVNFQGYPNTSGLCAMDYRITDEWADPPGMTERWHTESLVRLPGGFLCFSPQESPPAVGKVPCLKGGPITFGSCSKPPKWTHGSIEAWAAILRQVPDSRLLLHHSTAEGTQARVLETFFSHGILPHRIGFAGALEWSAHWEWFHQVDLALDPFPYNGTTGSCETLWMGVPFIALAGATHVARVGVSLLTRIGLEHLIARDVEEYISMAVSLAADRPALQRLRSGMRRRMRRSTLMNGAAFTREMEDAYRKMWAEWTRRVGRYEPVEKGY
jgi:predicted O-linked N-acetylglucosamine transferase (SPINDLY family)